MNERGNGELRVNIVDWIGNEGKFEIIRLKERSDGKVSVTFRNSIGDLETALVDEVDIERSERH